MAERKGTTKSSPRRKNRRNQPKIAVLYSSQLMQPAAPGDAIMPDADSLGRVIFRGDVPTSKLKTSLKHYLETAKTIFASATSELTAEFRIEKVKLKLAVDSKIGFAFVADAGLEAAVEIECVRHDPAADTLAAGGSR